MSEEVSVEKSKYESESETKSDDDNNEEEEINEEKEEKKEIKEKKEEIKEVKSDSDVDKLLDKVYKETLEEAKERKIEVDLEGFDKKTQIDILLRLIKADKLKSRSFEKANESENPIKVEPKTEHIVERWLEKNSNPMEYEERLKKASREGKIWW